jgi:hypothetical protein
MHLEKVLTRLRLRVRGAHCVGRLLDIMGLYRVVFKGMVQEVTIEVERKCKE